MSVYDRKTSPASDCRPPGLPPPRRVLSALAGLLLLTTLLVAVPGTSPAGANTDCEVPYELRTDVHSGGGQLAVAIVTLPAGAKMTYRTLIHNKSLSTSGNWTLVAGLYQLLPDGNRGALVDGEPIQGPGYYWNGTSQVQQGVDRQLVNTTGVANDFWFELKVTGTISIGLSGEGNMASYMTNPIVTDAAGATIAGCVELNPRLVNNPWLISAGYAADPVNVATGNFTDSWVDIAYGPADPLLGFARTYNSLEPTLGSLGSGWSVTYDDTIEAAAGSELWLTTSSGRLIVFTDDGAGGFESSGEFPGMLVDDGDGSYSVEYVDGTVKDFDGNGRLQSITDWAGRSVTIARDANGLATSATSSSGRSLTFVHNGNRRLTSVQSSDGQTITFGYDANGYLIDVDHVGNSWHFDVADQGLITEIRDGENRLVVANVYDAGTGRVIEQTTPHGGTVTFDYDTANDVTLVTDVASGDVTSYAYDRNGRLLGMTDTNAASTSRTWDANGHLATATDRAGNASTTSINPMGQLEQLITTDGTTTVDHDTLGRVTRTVAVDGLETLYAYTGTNRIPDTVTRPDGVVTITQSGGRITSIADPSGATFGYASDTAGNVTGTTDPTGLTTTYTHDAAGRVLTVTTPDGLTTTNTYGSTGLLTTTDTPTSGLTSFAYDGAGNLTSVTDAAGATVSYTYNTAGKVATVTDPVGAVTTYGYSTAGDLTTITGPDGGVTTYTYGPLGRVTAVSNPTGGQRSFTYDTNGQIDTVTDATGAVTSYTYDAAGRITSETTPTGATISSTFDAAGRVLTATDLAGAVTSYTYDAAGRLSTLTDPTGSTTTISYDSAGRISGRTFGDGTSVTYTYDSAGRRLTMVDPTGTTTYTYDSRGLLDTVTDPTGAQVGYDWVTANQVSAITYPDGSTASYTYTSTGQIDTVSHPDLGGFVDYTYNAAGQLTSSSLPGGLSRTYGYNAAGQLSSYTQTVDGGVNDATLSYDATGRIATTIVGGTTTTYTYDPAGQLTSSGPATYTYDNGRRTAAVTGDLDATYTYNDASQITTYTDNRAGGGGGGGGPAGGVAHVVVGNDTTIDPGDQNIIDRLTNDLGYAVTVIDDGAPENITGADLVVITQSVGTTQITGKYVDDAIPVLTMSTPTWDEHNLVAGQSADYPYTTSNTLDIQQPGHPTVNGATSPHASTRVTIGYALDTDVPPDAVIVAAAKKSRPDHAALIVFETGDNDATGNPVPAKRALLGYHRNATADLTTDGGWTIFDNTINWLHPTTQPPPEDGGGGGVAAPTYDAAGRLTSLGDTTIIYNAQGQPARVTVTDNTGTTTQDRTYNGDGHLVEVTITHPDASTETHHLVWDTISPVTQVLTHNIDGLTNNYLYGRQREAINRPDDTSDLFAYDHHGSTVATTATADIVAGSGFDPYGTPTGGINPATIGFGYRGELHLGPTIHLRSRTYLPEHGVFTTIDPLPSQPGSPTTANPYHYVNHDPANHVDPLGLRPRDTEFGNLARWGWEHRDGIALTLTVAGFVACGPACLAAGGLIGFASSAYGCSNGSNWDCGMVIVDVATLGAGHYITNARYADDALHLINDLPPAPRGLVNETAGGFTNLGRGSARGPAFFDDFSAGQGFSGVYDEATDSILAFPSGPGGVVPRRGGHAQVNQRLTEAIGAPRGQRAGFTAILQTDGSLQVQWLSRSVNPSGYVPDSLRPAIIDALSQTSGRTVVGS